IGALRRALAARWEEGSGDRQEAARRWLRALEGVRLPRKRRRGGWPAAPESCRLLPVRSFTRAGSRPARIPEVAPVPRIFARVLPALTVLALLAVALFAPP